jgi:outer membrane protein assembly factor BamD (BamD/ComL family)
MRLIIVATLIVIFSSCKNETKNIEIADSKEALEHQVDSVERLLYSYEAGSLASNQAAAKIVKLYNQLATDFPDDPKAPEYLFKAGEVSMGINMDFDAIGYFQRLERDYPKFNKAPHALFLQAFIWDNKLNDDGKAEFIYKQFLEKYPLHEMAKDAQFSLDNLGKSDEELIKEFEQKQKQQGV